MNASSFGEQLYSSTEFISKLIAFDNFSLT